MHLKANQLSPSADIFGLSQTRGGSQAMHSRESVAYQLEGLFVEMMLKSMRSASLCKSPGQNDAPGLFTSLYDQHIAQAISRSGKPGFARLILPYLSGGKTETEMPGQVFSYLSDQRGSAGAQSASGARALQRSRPAPVPCFTESSTGGFISRLLLPAMEASRKSGIPHQLILAQAALETGWGRHEILTAEGRPSYNLFSIKATPEWKGKTVDITTTEYTDGRPQKLTAAFKVYSSYADSLNDYLRLLTSHPRYKTVAHSSTPEVAAKRLQSAGYATDPDYAKKLISIMDKIKNDVFKSIRAYSTENRQ